MATRVSRLIPLIGLYVFGRGAAENGYGQSTLAYQQAAQGAGSYDPPASGDSPSYSPPAAAQVPSYGEVT